MPSKGPARSITERRGNFSLQLPLNKDASLLSRTTLNASANTGSTQEAMDMSNINKYTSGDGTECMSCGGQVPDSNCSTHSSESYMDNEHCDPSQDDQVIHDPGDPVEINLEPSINHTTLGI